MSRNNLKLFLGYYYHTFSSFKLNALVGIVRHHRMVLDEVVVVEVEVVEKEAGDAEQLSRQRR